MKKRLVGGNDNGRGEGRGDGAHRAKGEGVRSIDLRAGDREGGGTEPR